MLAKCNCEKFYWHSSLVRIRERDFRVTGIQGKFLNKTTQEECCSGKGDSESTVNKVNVITLRHGSQE